MPGKDQGAPDQFLLKGGGVCYRYVLLLGDTEEIDDIFHILEELSLVYRYFLLVPAAGKKAYRIYLGLASVDVFDFPLRMAALGVHVERGESIGGRTAMQKRIFPAGAR